MTIAEDDKKVSLEASWPYDELNVCVAASAVYILIDADWW